MEAENALAFTSRFMMVTWSLGHTVVFALVDGLHRLCDGPVRRRVHQRPDAAAIARGILGRAGNPEAAEHSLRAAFGLHRNRVNAVVEQAVGPLQGEIEGLQTKNWEMENKNRGLEKQKAELKQSVDQLRKQVQGVITKNREWSQAFEQETAYRQALEQRIKNCIEAMEDRRLFTRRDVIKAVVEHLQPQRAPA